MGLKRAGLLFATSKKGNDSTVDDFGPFKTHWVQCMDRFGNNEFQCFSLYHATAFNSPNLMYYLDPGGFWIG